jgi:hypothetical protein
MRAGAGKRGGLGLVAVLALMLVASPAAGARPNDRFPLLGFFQLPASNDYRIEGFVFGGLVIFTAESGNVSATYLVGGKRSDGRLVARFGRLGRLDLRFHPHGERGEERCDPAATGTYRGVLAFVGERRYTELHARRAAGFGLVPPPRDCAEPASASRLGRGPMTHLHAIARVPRGVASVSVLGFPGERRVGVAASREEQRGRMFILREASATVGGPNAFVASAPGEHPALARLKPPKPFAGSAVYEETGVGASSWSGDLSVWLPGAGRVPLAGPDFSSSLCRHTPERARCPFDPTVRRPLSTLQGSGSQSQLLAEARLSWSRYLRNSASSAGSTP